MADDSMGIRRRQLWYDQDTPEEEGEALVAMSEKYAHQFESRKTRAAHLLSMYEGLSLSGLTSEAYDWSRPLELFSEESDDENEDGTRMIANVGASVMDSIDAKLFALDKIKTAFVVSDGGWEAKRAAVLAGRFVEGQMGEPQGIFPDMWALWRHAARLAETCTGSAAVFFWSDPEEGKVVCELDDTLNLFVETSGLPYDGITSIGRCTYWDPEKLAAKYPEHADAIYSAVERPDGELQRVGQDGEHRPGEEAERVKLVQGWRMKAPGVPGRYCAAVDGATLETAEYDHNEPPCVFYTPMRQLAGFWGRTRLERIVQPMRRMNEILGSLDSAERLTPKGVVFYDPSVTPKEQLDDVQDVVLIPFTGPPDRKPVYEPPPPFHPLHLELLNLHKDFCYDLPGMNEAHVTASREKGLSSGVAIRLVQDQVYERFAPTEREFSRCVGPATARQIIRCAKEIMAAGTKFESTWKSAEKGGYLDSIPAGVFNVLDKYMYTVEPHAVSGNIGTPADRVELAEKLMSSGVITGEAYSAILQHFDVPGQSDGGIETLEEKFVEKQSDLWLYGELDDVERRYMGPEKWLQLEARLVQVGGLYLSAKMDMAGDDDPDTVRRLDYFLRFITEVEALIEEKAARESQLQAASIGAPGPAVAPPPPDPAAQAAQPPMAQ